jgi:hypothetical protein
MELKILASLRVLSKGWHFDGIAELSMMDEGTMRVWHHSFLAKFVEEKRSVFIKYPTTDAEAGVIERVFSGLGMPEAVGSTDCTHIPWGRCPAKLSSVFTGKEGFPTVAYEVTVDHHKRILWVTDGHPGARNDRSIVRFDEYVMAIKNKDILSEYSFWLKGSDGVEVEQRGAYLITDGGYHLWRCCQPPIKCAWSAAEVEWSCRLESVRKNVECMFGILKGRFRILKYPLMYHTRDKLDNTFIACCILHNMLLIHDGMDVSWQDPENWSYIDDDDADISYGLQRARARARIALLIGVNAGGPGLDKAFVGGLGGYADQVEVEDECHFLQRKLVVHYSKVKNTVGWTRRK